MASPQDAKKKTMGGAAQPFLAHVFEELDGKALPVSDSTPFPIKNIAVEGGIVDPMLAIAAGIVPGHSCVNKFGIAPSGLQVTNTDIWDRANAAPTQSIWLAPTAARIHTIASTSGSDVVGGVGVATVIVYYLSDWNTKEAAEVITGNLNAGIAMTNAAVIIHRMKVVAQATTTGVGGNIGTITATAAAPDSTITAVILPGNGQTEMAIYGVPSIQVAYMYAWNAQIDKAQGTVVSADFEIRVNENPNVQTLAFIRKDDISIQSTGVSSRSKAFYPPNRFPGPCIIKIQGNATTADTDGEASFDLVLIDN